MISSVEIREEDGKTYDVGELHWWDEVIVDNGLEFGRIECFGQILIIEWSSTIDIEN